MSTIELKESNAGEVKHLFDVMKEYKVGCSLELNVGNSNDPIISANGTVFTEYLESSDGDTLVVSFGGTEFAFGLGTHSFSKEVTGCQIFICIGNDDYTAWFNSGALSCEAIEMANDYDDTYEEFKDKVIGLKMSSHELSESLTYLNELISEGRVIKNVQVLSSGEQILTGVCRKKYAYPMKLN